MNRFADTDSLSASPSLKPDHVFFSVCIVCHVHKVSAGKDGMRLFVYPVRLVLLACYKGQADPNEF